MAYEYYGAGAQQQQATSNRDALLYLLSKNPVSTLAPKNDFNLGGVSPAPASATSAPPPATPGGANPAKAAAIDFDALGNRDYLNKYTGGSAWEDINGPAPAGYEYNANGGLKKISFGSKLDSAVMSPTGFALGIGGMAALPALGAGGLAGSAARQVGTAAATGLIGNTLAPGANAPTQSFLSGQGGTPASNAATGAGAPPAGADTGTAQGAAAGGGMTLPDQIDTNGFAKPGYAVQGSPQAPPGWDQSKWADPSHQSPKYVVGRILSQYPQTTEGLSQAMAEIQQAYPGSQQTGEDTISIPGVSTSLDVVKAGGGFWWGPETDASGNPYPKGASGDEGGGGDSSGGYNASGDVATSDVIAKIIARLSGMAGGKSQGAGVMSARDALLQQFGA
jgi:hypothetical protein